VYFDGVEVETPVYAWDDLAVDQVLAGPTLVVSETTTLVVPPSQTARVDEGGDVRLALVGA
jgi:N-methylhydantoinase A/oxoprolinase/acetone carboxylase beta subunit